MPAVGPDGIGVGPLPAGILDLVCEPEHRGDAGERGRLRGRQLPSDRVDLVTHSPGTIPRFPRFIRTNAIFDISLILSIDDFAMDNLGSPVCGDQRKGRIDHTGGAVWGGGGHGSHGEGADTGDTGAGSNGEKAPAVRIGRRVHEWRDIHAFSLGHWRAVLVARVRAGAEVRSFPSACFDVIMSTWINQVVLT